MRLPFFPFCCLALAACSSVSVIEERENAALAPQSAPSTLYVRPFPVAKDARFDVSAPRGEQDPQASVARNIIDGLVSRGVRWVAPVEVLADGDNPPAEGLLVDGRILFAEQGSRALRIGIGFGAGRSRLDTTVRVFNLGASAKEAWLTCKTTGGSNREPGILVGLAVPPPAAVPLVAGIAGGAVGGVVGGVAKSSNGVSQDARRTGRAIAALIHDHLASKGLVRRKAWPKRSGSLGTPVGELNLPKFD